MSGTTPGQAAYEAWRAKMPFPTPDWDKATGTDREAFSDAAQAAIAAQPQPASEPPGLRSALVDAMVRWSGRDAWDEYSSELAAILDKHPMVTEPQPAPELAAAIQDVIDRYPEADAAPQPGSEAAELRAVIDMIWRMCQNPKQAAGTSQGVVVNGERLAERIAGLIKNSGMEPF